MSTVTLDRDALATLGTCVLAVDTSHTIVWVSTVLAKLARRRLLGLEIEQVMVSGECGMYHLRTGAEQSPAIPLRGTWIPLVDPPGHGFVGSPAPQDADDVAALGLSSSDFLENDLWLDRLVRIDEATTASNDARARIAQLKQERQRLALANKSMANARRAALNLMQDADIARQEAERSKEKLRDAQQDLVALSHEAGMAQVATDVLHGVGNALNGVTVSAATIADKIRGSKAAGLAKIAEVLHEHRDDLASFVGNDERGRMLPEYLAKLTVRLGEEHATLLAELDTLIEGIEHIGNIVASQEKYAVASNIIREPVSIHEVMDDALRVALPPAEDERIQVARQYEAVPRIMTDRRQVHGILVTLISNAKEALRCATGPKPCLTVRIETTDADRVRATVIDNGVGLDHDALASIFRQTAATFRSTEGLGLHGCAIAAKQLGGNVTADSQGLGTGAVFTLELPLHHADATDTPVVDSHANPATAPVVAVPS